MQFDVSLLLQIAKAEPLQADRRLDIIAQDRFPVSTSPVSMTSMPSRSSAVPKAGSLATRFCTNASKLRVNTACLS
jgi:hypothetical protein